MSTDKNKQDIVLELIKEGGAKKADLLAAGWPEADEKSASASLASVFTGLRMAARFATDVELCPVTDEDGVYSLIKHDEWEAMQAEKKPAKAPKTPEEQLEAATKRVARAEKAVGTAEKRNDKDPSTKNGLLFKRAELELELAKIDLEEAEDAVATVEA